MGLSTHRTHTYGAQHPHLWGSAPPAPRGGRSPTSGCGSVPSGGSEGLHPPPHPIAAPRPTQRHPSPHRVARRRFRGTGGVASSEWAWLQRKWAWPPSRQSFPPPKGRGLTRWAWPKRRRGSAGGVVTGSGRGLRGRRALPHKLHNVGLCPITETRDPTAPWALPHNQPYVGLSPITAPMWGSAP